MSGIIYLNTTKNNIFCWLNVFGVAELFVLVLLLLNKVILYPCDVYNSSPTRSTVRLDFSFICINPLEGKHKGSSKLEINSAPTLADWHL